MTMTSVWLVWSGDYEQRGISMAFASKSVAEAYVAHREASPDGGMGSGYEIEELVLDDENFPRGAWRYTIQSEPGIGGWGVSCHWHGGVNADEPATCRGQIIAPRGHVVGGASWEGYGATKEAAQASAELMRANNPNPPPLGSVVPAPAAPDGSGERE